MKENIRLKLFVSEIHEREIEIMNCERKLKFKIIYVRNLSLLVYVSSTSIEQRYFHIFSTLTQERDRNHEL